ncbi:hypothetical protein EX30DRAFT_343976 [Ascodesmis nigricans]|uniref:Uncharacterized protein n=1 Tax=Ascodesmis nigricans TaxID=341454 RepID=A0A4S2MKS7_9PEZI|nr:hypothetical protein EX30DRAFT_343976 [Ascodesmis nigricans]
MDPDAPRTFPTVSLSSHRNHANPAFIQSSQPHSQCVPTSLTPSPAHPGVIEILLPNSPWLLSLTAAPYPATPRRRPPEAPQPNGKSLPLPLPHSHHHKPHKMMNQR